MSEQGGKGKFNILGWIAGVAGSIIAGVTIWALTQEEGPLSRPEVPVSPFQIVDIQFSGGGTTFKIGRSIRYTGTVVNTGDQAGNSCHLSASPRHVNDDSNVARAVALTDPFGLLPGETKELRRTVPIDHMDRAGQYRITFHLSCTLAGSGGHSSAASVTKYVRLKE